MLTMESASLVGFIRMHDHVDESLSTVSIDVTLYQRGPTYVMSTKEGYKRLMNRKSRFILQ